MVSYGVFLPVGNNGWILSTTSPQYEPSFALQRTIVQKAEQHGFDFALAMLKYRGYGGETQHWNHTIDPMTLMASLAPLTSTIKLYATVSPLSYNPIVVAKMAQLIDEVSGGRFGINLVAGWNRSEYAQMGAWRGDDYYGYRYDFLSEFTQILLTAWETGHVTFHGKYFDIEDCEVLPKPVGHVDLISAGTSSRGRRFVAEYADYHFGAGSDAAQVAASNALLAEASESLGRTPGAFAQTLVVLGDTDADAARKVELYQKGVDVGAVQGMIREYSNDTSTDGSSAMVVESHKADISPFYGGGALVGSPQTVADHLNAIAAVPGTAGVMLTFDDFVEGIDRFGTEVMPLLDHLPTRTAAAPTAATAPTVSAPKG
ncbi:LLM class flavin-dependent oxidoreductase [Herbiconiux moechotypicola]|uniref:Pyrimidine utilization protein A n=1 Tax=Herbiconiux moechotypicola TaxID=637393 RepID=A0ABP5QFF6_9MICO|nr:LLM class flavin-dependent oxidoreductase [Herbiconiux moechotypicola]MCS5729964.1 LLM class flavin-dependent oxidoreductase [Herbiconiux moechotypicola]